MAPFIKGYLGFNEIEAMFMSHYHRDHVGGASHIVEEMNGNIKAVYSSGVYSAGVGERGQPEDVIRQNAFDEAIQKYNIPHYHVKYGDTVEGFADILSPLPSALQGLDTDDRGRLITENPNDNTGMCVRFNYSDFSIFLNGDFNALDDLHAEGIDMSCTIMQIPHHGDRVYISENVMNNASPDLSILGTAAPGRINPAIDLLDSLNLDWWHIGWNRERRKYIEGQTNGSFTTSEALPMFVKYNRGSLV